MSGWIGGLNFMEISKSSPTDNKMAVDGSSSKTLVDFAVDEKIESKEWIANPGNTSVQQDDLCQDDIFSLDEISGVAAAGQPEEVVIETTACTVSVASISEQCYGKGSVTIPILDEMTEQVSTEEILQLKSEKNYHQLTNEVSVEIDASNEEFLESGLVVHDSNNSLASLDENNSNNDANVTQEIVQGSKHDTKHAETVVDVQIGGEHDEEIENPANMSTDDINATEDGVKKIERLPDMPTEDRDAVDNNTGGKDQKEPVQLNQFILDNSQNVENASTTNAQSANQEDQSHLNQPKTEQLESLLEQKHSETAVMKEEEETFHPREPGLEALKGMQDHQKQPEMKAAFDVTTGDKDQKEVQITLDNSQHVENVSTTLAVSAKVENRSHPNEPEKEQTELIWEQKQPDGAVMKGEEENSYQRQPRLEALNEKKEHSHQKQPDIEAIKEEENGSCQYLEEMPKTAQAASGVDEKSEVNDNKVSTSDGQLPSQFENVLQGASVYKGIEESKEIEATASKHLGSDKEEFASHLNHPAQELSENMQSENALPNSCTLASIESNPDLPQGGITDGNAEPMEHRDVEQSENMQKEFESLKGRKVSKRFKKKKFLGEVIGYDPESGWFKVLYEDGDEEELEKEELDCILLPVGDAKVSASRKRHLSTDDEHKNPNRSVKKSRKLDVDGTPGKSRKDNIAEDQTPLSQQTSEAKKKKATVARGKSKSSKTNTPKAQTGRKRGSSTKKTIEKKGSANSSRTKSKKPKSPKKQSVAKVIQDSERQHSSVTKTLKFDSAKKKTPTKLKKSAQDSPKKDKITRSGRTVRVPNKSPKVRSVDTGADDKVEVQKISTAEKSEVHTPRQKRKSGSDIQGGSSTMGSKRAKKTKTVNDMTTPLGSSMKSRSIVEDAKLQISHKKTDDAEFQVQLNEEKGESSVPQSTGNRRGKADRGTVLIGRKVRKDFGGQLFGGEVTDYKIFYKVVYEDGDSEELTWKELESILLLDEGFLQNKIEEQQSVKSKSKQKKVYKRTHTDVTHLIHFEL